jgi:hypothetical protein
MKCQLSQISKESIITTDSYGAVVKKGIVYDITHNQKRDMEVYTLIKVIDFNFLTKKVVINCVKGVTSYNAEVSVDFLMTHCEIETPNPNQKIYAIMIQHVSHNLLDKDTAIFIIIMTLTYLVGMVLGRGL